MANIQSIDYGATDWSKIINENFKAIGNGNGTFSDTGWVKDGVTLVNGAQIYSAFPGDQPAYRIVQLGTLNLLFINGSVKGLDYAAGEVNVNVANFPVAVPNWFTAHQTVNTHYNTDVFATKFNWIWNGGDLKLQQISTAITPDTWVGFSEVFIA